MLKIGSVVRVCGYNRAYKLHGDNLYPHSRDIWDEMQAFGDLYVVRDVRLISNSVTLSRCKDDHWWHLVPLNCVVEVTNDEA